MKTRRRNYRVGLLALATVAGILPWSPILTRAETAPEEVKELQAEIQNRKATIETINKKLDQYKAKIAQYAKQSASLLNDVAMLENEQAMAELDVAATQAEIDTAQLELEIVTAKIVDADARLKKEKEMLRGLLFALHKQETNGNAFELILGARTFEDVFRATADLQSINGDVNSSLAATLQTRDGLSHQMSEQDKKLQSLEELEVELSNKIDVLEGRKSAKEVLALETSQSESEYRVLMSELRQEQQSITARIRELQNEVDTQLTSDDESSELSVISWPLTGRITTTFHDPTYPFRNLFEHSGLDIAIPQGTAVASGAPGVVAWAKTGRQYGNYVMIIHADGMATLYAHLSRIDVVEDQYVGRGQVIGLSGGRPGTQGAGFSTGPHLHFEVRKAGIPVNPMTFLP